MPDVLAIIMRRREQMVRRRIQARRIPPQRQPDGIRRAYFQEIRKILRRARALVDERLLPRLPELLDQAARERGDSEGRCSCLDTQPDSIRHMKPCPVHQPELRMDAIPPGKRVNAIMDAVSDSFFRDLNVAQLERMAASYAEATSDDQAAQLLKQLRAAIGIEPPLRDAKLGPLIQAFTAENVGLIKSIPNQYFDEVEKRTLRAVSEGTRAADLVPELAQRYGVSESRAQLIANDQIGKFFGEMNRARQTELGVDGYTWRTSNDNRVRDEHREREGLKFTWDSPPADGHPGHAINCRCFAEPDFTTILAAL